MNPYHLLVIGAAFLNTIANTLIKSGAARIGEIFGQKNPLLIVSKLLTNWPLVFGLSFFGLTFILWVWILSKVQLSVAAPLMSMGYVFVLVTSYLLFHEPVTMTKLAGTGAIILGVILITR